MLSQMRNFTTNQYNWPEFSVHQYKDADNLFFTRYKQKVPEILSRKRASSVRLNPTVKRNKKRILNLALSM